MFLQISQSSQENTCARVSFLTKLQATVCNFVKIQTLTLVFSYEFCEISKNTFFTEHLRATASQNNGYFFKRSVSTQPPQKNYLIYEQCQNTNKAIVNISKFSENSPCRIVTPKRCHNRCIPENLPKVTAKKNRINSA